MLIRDFHDKVGDIAPDQRALALRRLTDLYLVGEQQFSADDLALIDDIFIHLLEVIEESARALLASRLAPLAKAPPKVLHRLACDNAIDVASALLVQSEALNDATLIECAVTRTQDHMLAISRRKTLSEAVTDVLVKRGDRDVVLSTAMNAGARFSKGSLAILVRRAQGDDALAECVGRRPDLPEALFERLLETASDTVRTALETERRHAKHDIARAIDDVTAHIRSEVAAQKQTQAQATALVRVQSLNRAGKLNRARIEAFARAGHREELVAALALMANVPAEVVADILDDKNRQFLFALVKTVRLPWETTRIIMAPAEADGPSDNNGLDDWRGAFEKLQQPTARAILDSRCATLSGKKPH